MLGFLFRGQRMLAFKIKSNVVGEGFIILQANSIPLIPIQTYEPKLGILKPGILELKTS